MTAKEYLLQYKRLTALIRNAEDTLADLREERASISTSLDGMPRGTSLADKTGRLATMLADLSEYVVDKRMEAWEKREEISEVISSVQDGTLSRLLYLRYIDGCRWEEIADELHYTCRWITSTHGDALAAVQEILDRRE